MDIEKKNPVKKATIELEIYEDYSYDLKIVESKHYDVEKEMWCDELERLFHEDHDSEEVFSLEDLTSISILKKTRELSAKNQQILYVLDMLNERYKMSGARWSEQDFRTNLSDVIGECANELGISRSSVGDKITRKIDLTVKEFAQFSQQFLEMQSDYKASKLFRRIYTLSSKRDQQLLFEEYDKVFMK